MLWCRESPMVRRIVDDEIPPLEPGEDFVAAGAMRWGGSAIDKSRVEAIEKLSNIVSDLLIEVTGEKVKFKRQLRRLE
jgi:hypothetical protein